MSLIYCLYAADECRPRYVGQTTKSVDIRLAQHLGDARRGAATAVGGWIRGRLAAGFPIHAHILQWTVAPVDLDLFERYWIGQFTDLLNADGAAPRAVTHSAIARTVIAFLQDRRHHGPSDR